MWGSKLSKKTKASANTVNTHLWITALKKSHPFQALLVQLQHYICVSHANIPFSLQLHDFQNNLKISTAFPMVGVQVKRIRQALAGGEDWTECFNKFTDAITDQIEISEQSRQHIDPGCKSVHDFSSKITAYQQWLIHALFPLLCIQTELQNDIETCLNDYLLLLNKIISASTISRVKLRQSAQIDSESLIEIPRNTLLQIQGEAINQHWIKVSVQLDGQEFEGFLQRVYLIKND